RRVKPEAAVIGLPNALHYEGLSAPCFTISRLAAHSKARCGRSGQASIARDYAARGALGRTARPSNDAYFRTLRGIVIFPVIGSTIAITVSVGESALVPVENGSDTGRRVENGEHVLDMFFRC